MITQIRTVSLIVLAAVALTHCVTRRSGSTHRRDYTSGTNSPFGYDAPDGKRVSEEQQTRNAFNTFF